MDEVGCTVKGRFAVGIVALSGKVVEHVRGHRAENAAVRVQVVANRGELRVMNVDVSHHDLSKDPLMAETVASTVLPESEDDDAMRTTIKDYLEERAERYQAWNIGKQQRVIVVTPLEVTDEDGYVDEGEATTLLTYRVDDAASPVDAPASIHRAHLRSESTSRPHNR